MRAEIINARLDIQLVINKQLMRAKISGLSDEKRQGILSQVEALDNALKVFKSLQSENDNLFRATTDLYIENLQLKKNILYLQKKELEL